MMTYIAFITKQRREIKEVLDKLVREGERLGLKINAERAKIMRFGHKKTNRK